MKRIAIIGRDHYYTTELAQKLIDNNDVELLVVIGKDLTLPISKKLIYINTLPYFPLTTVFIEHNIDTIIHLVKVDDETYSSREAYNLTLESLRNVISSGARASIKNYLFYRATVVYGTNKKESRPFLPNRIEKLASKFYYTKLRYQSEKIIYDFIDDFHDFDLNIKIARAPFTLGQNVDNLISNYLKLSFIPLIKGYNPLFEFTHEKDIVNALNHLVFNGDSGIYNLSPGGAVELKTAAGLMGKKLIGINKLIAKQCTFLSWFLFPNLINVPPNALEYLMYPFITDNKTLLDTGFKFSFTVEETLREFKALQEN